MPVQLQSNQKSMKKLGQSGLVKERALLCSAPAINAILNGATITYLIIGQVATLGRVTEFQPSNTTGYDWTMRNRRMLWNDLRHAELLNLCPYGMPGDRLWCREVWAPGDSMVFDREKEDPETVLYKADLSALGWDGRRMSIDYDTYAFNWRLVRWQSPILMPRWASRITLEIGSVRIERLHDISDEDAIAAGIERCDANIDAARPNLVKGAIHVDRYARWWDAIYGAGSWDANPYVWRIEFEEN